MEEPPWMPRTEEEYQQQLAEEIAEAMERQRQPENQPPAYDDE